MAYCSEDLIFTYEALRLVSQFKICFDEAKMLHSKLQNCSNDICVRSIMCEEIRQQYCTAEWRVLELNESEGLIDCSDYGETVPLNCSDQFGLANNDSVCLPLCEKFSQFSETLATVVPISLVVSNGINVVGGIVNLIVSMYKIKKL